MPQALKPYRATRVDTALLSAALAFDTGYQAFTVPQLPKALLAAVGMLPLILCNGLIALGFVLVLLGCVWRGTNHVALSVEMIGRVTLVLPSLAYGILALHLTGVAVMSSIGLLWAVAASSVYRVVFIHKQLRRLRTGLLAAIEEHRENGARP